MGSRKIIKQVQVPAETTGNLYTLARIHRRTRMDGVRKAEGG